MAIKKGDTVQISYNENVDRAARGLRGTVMEVQGDYATVRHLNAASSDSLVSIRTVVPINELTSIDPDRMR